MHGPLESFDPSRGRGTPAPGGKPASEVRGKPPPRETRRRPLPDPPPAPPEHPPGFPLPSAAFRGSGFSDLPHALHICLVYERAAEARAAGVAFFAAGLTAGERCLYQGGGANWRRLERALASTPLAAERDRRRGVARIA